jgi:hypothetical protein
LRPYVSQSQFRSALSAHGERAAVSNALSLAETVGGYAEMSYLKHLLLVICGCLFLFDTVGQNSVDMVKYTFRDGMKLKPKYRSIDITINRNDSIPIIRVEIDRSSIDDLVQAELKAIEMMKAAKNKTDSLAVRSKVGRLKRSDTTYSISVLQLDVIENMLLSLDEEQVQKSLEATEGTDGTSSYLVFKRGDKYIRYDIWTPNYRTKKRGLEELLRTINQILTTGLIEPKDVWN